MVKPLTPQQMVEVRAFAPFEIVEVMKEWLKRWGAAMAADQFHLMDDEQAIEFMRTACDGLGAPYQSRAETREQFGIRVATAIFTLIKEI